MVSVAGIQARPDGRRRARRRIVDALLMASELPIVVFSDVDGVFYDPDQRAVGDAARALAALGRAAVSLVLCSSKTRAEVETIQQALGIHHPFVCESGAATFVPAGYFPFDVPQARDLAGYQAVEFGRPHAEIAQALRRTAARLRVDMVAFGDMSVDEVARDCHLSLLQARLAKLPEYGERFRVRDRRAAARGRLFDALQASHLRCIRGAHFDYVGAPVENSLGVALLRTLYHRAFGAVVTVGLADAMADDNLLQLVDRRVIVGDEDPARGGVDVAAWARAIVDIVEEVRGDRACTGR